MAIVTPNERYHKIFTTVWLLIFTIFQYQTFFAIS